MMYSFWNIQGIQIAQDGTSTPSKRKAGRAIKTEKYARTPDLFLKKRSIDYVEDE
jgi:hypothetical protein